MKSKLVAFFFACMCFSITAQNTELRKFVNKPLQDLNVVELQKLIEYYKYQNMDTAMIYAQLLEERNKNITDINIQLENIGLIARVYIHLEYYDIALQYYQEFLPQIDLNKQPELYADLLQYIANVYSYMRHYDESVKYFKKSAELRDPNNVLGLVHSYHGAGDDYRLNKKYDSAYYFLNMGYELIEHIEDKELSGQITLAFAETLMSLDSISRAEQVIDYVVEKLEYQTISAMGKGYVPMVRGIYEAKLGNFDIAISYFKKALAVAKSMNYNLGLITIYEEYIPALEKSGNYKLAYEHNQIFYELKLASYKDGQEKQVKQLEIIHETKLKQTALENQKEELQKKQTIIITLSIGVLLVIILLVIVYRNYSAKQKMTIHLAEKNNKIETLMRELHHRVKNNLQVISSLLGLQSMKMEEGEARMAVEEGKSRVRAMAMIHQKLYNEDDLIGVDFHDYVSDLVKELKNTYYPERDIKMIINVPKQSMDVDTTLPLGLMINEIVSNSFKYAFNDIKQPTLKVELLSKANEMKLVVSDNGKGISDDFDISKINSFGMKLIKMLSKQLSGELKVLNESGLRYELSFMEKTS